MYWWANHGIVEPSVSAVRERLWSFSDLMALRVVSWLRHPKAVDDDEALPASPMSQVRMALSLLDGLGVDLWQAECESPLLVDQRGDIFVNTPRGVLDTHGQPALLPERALQLVAPFHEGGGNGPHLLRPGRHLRIVPAKVAGEPHIAHSRVTTQAVAALARRGFTAEAISDMYGVGADAVREGIDLEHQLSTDVLAA